MVDPGERVVMGLIRVLQKKLGVLPKDVATGPFVDEWKKVFATISKDVEEVDMSLAMSITAFSVKDENELVRCFPRN